MLKIPKKEGEVWKLIQISNQQIKSLGFESTSELI